MVFIIEVPRMYNQVRKSYISRCRVKPKNKFWRPDYSPCLAAIIVKVRPATFCWLRSNTPFSRAHSTMSWSLVSTACSISTTTITTLLLQCINYQEYMVPSLQHSLITTIIIHIIINNNNYSPLLRLKFSNSKQYHLLKLAHVHNYHHR